MIGELSNQQIEEVLQNQIIGRIGCTDKQLTYVVPISYVYDGENIYCHTQEGMKIKIMRDNPNVCFEVDTLQNMANWQSVICWGTFKEITDAAERRKAIEKLALRNLPAIASKTVKLFPEYPFYPEDLNKLEGIVFRIKIEKKTGRFEQHEEVKHSSL